MEEFLENFEVLMEVLSDASTHRDMHTDEFSYFGGTSLCR